MYGSLQLWRKKSGVWLQCLHSAFGLGAVASPLVLGWSGLQPSFLAIAGVSTGTAQHRGHKEGHIRRQEGLMRVSLSLPVCAVGGHAADGGVGDGVGITG